MAATNGGPVLQVTGLNKHFLGVTALHDVDITIHRGELASLIGPNGSGKTTFFNCVTGLMKQDGGQVLFNSQNITNMRPDLIARKGLRRSFQDVRNFPAMTVMENLLTAVQQHQEDSLWDRFMNTTRIRQYEAQAQARALEVLEMVELMHVRDQAAGTLSSGQRRLMEFAAVLMPDPDLILLDEPTAAVSTEMIDRMKAHIRALHGQGKTFLIVEHNMSVVMDLSERVIVLDHGQKIAEGTPAEIQQNQQVLEAYFGS